MHYLHENQNKGNTEAIVMIHGNPGWSFFYRKLVIALRDSYRCIVPDHIGMGLSDKPDNKAYRFTLDQRANDFELLLDHLNITNNITLVLHDWGGIIGMAYATHYPERIKRLIVLNTSAFHLPKGYRIPWQLKLSRIPVIGTILNQGFNVFARGSTKLCVTNTIMSPEIAAAYLAPYNKWSHRRSIQKFILDIPLKPGGITYKTVEQIDKAAEKLSNIPVLICWGMKDFVFTHHFLREWKKRFPNVYIFRFEDAGHYILEDAPEDVIHLIQQFLHTHS